MAFTTAGTVAVTRNGSQLFQGLFSDMWGVSITGANPASIAAGAEDTQTYTVPGVVLGDMVLFDSLSVSETVDGDVNAYVSAANTITVRITNLNAAAALDYAAGTTFKILIGRPAW